MGREMIFIFEWLPRRHRHHERPIVTFDITIHGVIAFAIHEEYRDMADIAVLLTDSEQTIVRASGGADADGNPISGVTFAYAAPDDASIVTITDNGDGTASVVHGSAGTTAGIITGTAPDGSTATATVTYTVSGGGTTTGALATFDVTADAPTPV